MYNWTTTKEKFINDHKSKPLKQQQRRLNALIAIESILQTKYPALLKDDLLFKNVVEAEMLDLYEKAKGKPLSGAEKSVIHGLYKFSI
jgi:hypothetical protein